MTRLQNAVIFALVLLLTVFVPPAFAGTQSTNCGTGRVIASTLYENAAGDTSDGDDRLNLCIVDSDANNHLLVFRLQNIDHILPTACNNNKLGGGTWNDCINGLSVAYPFRVCVYQNNTPLSGLMLETIWTSRRSVSPADEASAILITKAYNNCTGLPIWYQT